MKISDVIKRGAKYNLDDLSPLETMKKLFECAYYHADPHDLQIAFNTPPPGVRKVSIKDFFRNLEK